MSHVCLQRHNWVHVSLSASKPLLLVQQPRVQRLAHAQQQQHLLCALPLADKRANLKLSHSLNSYLQNNFYVGTGPPSPALPHKQRHHLIPQNHVLIFVLNQCVLNPNLRTVCACAQHLKLHALFTASCPQLQSGGPAALCSYSHHSVGCTAVALSCCRAPCSRFTSLCPVPCSSPAADSLPWAAPASVAGCGCVTSWLHCPAYLGPSPASAGQLAPARRTRQGSSAQGSTQSRHADQHSHWTALIAGQLALRALLPFSTECQRGRRHCMLPLAGLHTTVPYGPDIWR